MEKWWLWRFVGLAAAAAAWLWHQLGFFTKAVRQLWESERVVQVSRQNEGEAKGQEFENFNVQNEDLGLLRTFLFRMGSIQPFHSFSLEYVQASNDFLANPGRRKPFRSLGTNSSR